MKEHTNVHGYGLDEGIEHGTEQSSIIKINEPGSIMTSNENQTETQRKMRRDQQKQKFIKLFETNHDVRGIEFDALLKPDQTITHPKSNSHTLPLRCRSELKLWTKGLWT